MRITAFTALFLCAFSACGQKALGGDDKGEGFVYIHSLRNSPTFSRQNEALYVKNGDILPAKALTVDCGFGQFAMLALSNTMTILVCENSSVTLDTLLHSAPYETKLSYETQPVPSDVVLTVEKGDVYLLSPALHDSTNFKIATSHGILKLETDRFFISKTDSYLTLAIVKGEAEFTHTNGGVENVKAGQILSVKQDAEKGYLSKFEPLKSNQLSVMNTKFAQCSLVLNSVAFSYGEDAKLSAMRKIPKTVLMVPTKRERSK